MIISAQNPSEMRCQITQGKIWHKFVGMSYKVVVAVQLATNICYLNRVPLSDAPKMTRLSQNSLWYHWENTSVFTAMEVTYTTRRGVSWTSSIWKSMEMINPWQTSFLSRKWKILSTVPWIPKKYYTMVVHYSKDKACLFRECGKVLYYLDISNP